MDAATLIGVAGASILLVAFVANEFHFWTTESFTYDLANLVGAGLLGWYAYLIGSVPFVILEGVWAAVALRDVMRWMWAR
jgi:hypothetical protein